MPKVTLVDSGPVEREPSGNVARTPLAGPPLVGPPSQFPPPPPTPENEFEQRFLEFAYTTDYVINAPAVAYALKVPIEDATERLEDLAARDVLIREVDARGSVFFQLPGRQQVKAAQAAAHPVPGVPGVHYYPSPPATMPPYHYPPSPTALAPYGPNSLEAGASLTAPSENTALAALLVNTLCLPGLGSIIGGRASTGIGQLLLFLIGIPFCILFVGVPMVLAAWIWALVTGIDVMNQAKQAQAQRRLSG